MHSPIRQIAQDILLRKSLCWSKGVIPKEEAPTHEDLYLFEMQLIILNDKLISIDEQGSKCKAIIRSLKNIHYLKQNLDNETWPPISSIPLESKNWYIHDLLFLTGLCYYLSECLFLLQGYCKPDQCPSFISCSILHQKDLLRSISINNKLIEHHPWLNRIINEKSDLQKLLLRLKVKTLNNCYLLNESIERIHRCPPVSLNAENYFIKVIKDCLSVIGHNNLPKHDYKRQHLATSLCLSMLGVSEGSFLIEAYQLNLIKQLNHKSEWESECHFWKFQASFINSEMPEASGDKEAAILRIKQLIKFMETQVQALNKPTISKPLLIWHDSTMEFAKYFHSAISNRHISLNGLFDIEPFVKYLHQIIAVKKDKGNGFLSCASLLTYFKQINADTFNR